MKKYVFLVAFIFCTGSWGMPEADGLGLDFVSKESKFSGFIHHKDESILTLDEELVLERCQLTHGDEHILSGDGGGAKDQYSLDRRTAVSVGRGPYSAVFPIRTYPRDNLEGSYYLGTAFAVGSQVALTAAHNVCLRNLSHNESERIPFENSIVDKVSCYYGMDGGSFSSLLSVDALAFRKEWTGDEFFRAYDYALLFFDDLISVKAGQPGTLNVIAPKNFEESDEDFLITGYPKTVGKVKDGESVKEEFHEKGLQQYKHEAQVLRSCGLERFGFKSKESYDKFLSENHLLEDRNLFHKVDTTGGQSGSPIINKRDFSAVGMHTGGFSELRYNFNRGIKFTKGFFDDLENFYRAISQINGDSENSTYPVEMENERLKCWDAGNCYVVLFKNQQRG